MTFRQYPSSPALQHLVAYFWTLQAGGADANDAAYRFVPDGYVDWVFHLGTPWKYHFPTRHEHKFQHAAHIFGQMKNYVDLYLPDGSFFLLGVKFYPWAVRNIWKIDMHQLTDKELSLNELDLPGLTLLEEQIHGEKEIKNMIQRIEAYLSPWRSAKLQEEVSIAIKQIYKSPLELSFSGLNIQSRRLEQRFQQEIGIPPKLFQRIVRINRVIEKMIATPRCNFTTLAYQFGYFDQSHFIRDFRQFTGFTPSSFLQSIKPSGDILNLRIA
ncbi:MAG: AraC family transcriptional regulator [Saprospiraceae bacterium]|nr:MAG: AraC family transcriptional regulator [Saprospiraceae bacterium]